MGKFLSFEGYIFFMDPTLLLGIYYFGFPGFLKLKEEFLSPPKSFLLGPEK